jgi:hypothetical protein
MTDVGEILHGVYPERSRRVQDDILAKVLLRRFLFCHSERSEESRFILQPIQKSLNGSAVSLLNEGNLKKI